MGWGLGNFLGWLGGTLKVSSQACSPLLPIPPVLALSSTMPAFSSFLRKMALFVSFLLPVAALGLCRSVQAFSGCGGGLSSLAELCGPLIVRARAPRARASVAVAHGFRWSWHEDLPDQKLDRHSLLFQGGLLTTGPAGQPSASSDTS